MHLEVGQYLGPINRIFDGDIPYRDVMFRYGPLGIYLPALVMKLFGATIETLRAYFHFSTILGIIIAYLLALKILKTRIFVYIVTFSIMVETFNPFWSNRWGALRGGMGLLVLLALFMSLSGSNGRKWLFTAGIINAATLLYSTEYGVFATFATFMFFLFQKYANGIAYEQVRDNVVSWIAGYAAIIAPFLLFYMVTGALAEYLRITFIDYTFNHFSKFAQPGASPFLPESLGLVELYKWLFGLSFKVYLPSLVFIAAIAYLSIELIKRRWGNGHLVMATLAVYGLPLYLTAFRAIRGPQLETSIAPAIFIGFILAEKAYLFAKSPGDSGVDETIKPGQSKQLFRFAILSLSLFYIAFSDNRPWGKGMNLLRANYNKISNIGADLNQPGFEKLKLEKAGGALLPKEQAQEITAVVNYIVTHTGPDESIFAFPDMGAYYFLTDRKNISRFPLAVDAYARTRFKTELLQALITKKPKYIIYDLRTSDIARSVKKKDIDLLPEIIAFIRKNYVKEKQFGWVLILSRRDIQLKPSR